MPTDRKLLCQKTRRLNPRYSPNGFIAGLDESIGMVDIQSAIHTLK